MLRVTVEASASKLDKLSPISFTDPTLIGALHILYGSHSLDLEESVFWVLGVGRCRKLECHWSRRNAVLLR